MYYTLIVQFQTERIKALIHLLEKIQAQMVEKNITDADLLDMRLAPDMFPLVKQIQMVSDNAKGSASRLSGKENPKMEDTESTVAELIARLESTLEFLASLTEVDFVDADTAQARFAYFPGVYMQGQGYLIGYALPNFMFHVTTAYAILRHHGFHIGKGDFLGGLPLIPDTLPPEAETQAF
jgi:uncharacterized protein